MQYPGLLSRYLAQDVEISRQHGHALVRILRKLYGLRFAEGFSPRSTLAEVLAASHRHSLSQLHHDQLRQDYEAGQLEAKIRQHESS